MKNEELVKKYVEYIIDDKYVFEQDNYILMIDVKIFDEETFEYAQKIVQKYEKEKDSILDFMLKNRLREFYSSIYNYSDEEIKDMIGRPIILIDTKKDNDHPNWKFKYMGTIEYCEHKLDEHIISIDFMDDLQLDDNVSING